MSRYTASEVIQLPRLTAMEGLMVGGQLIAAARPLRNRKQLPRGIARALGELAEQHARLSKALREEASAGQDTPTSTVKSDRTLDGCWNALDSFLSALSRLPPGYPQASEAAALRSAILPGGLTFLVLPRALAWAESQRRLDRIRGGDLDARVAALGGRLFLDALYAEHEASGARIGSARWSPAEPARVREALDSFIRALREYLVKVVAVAEPELPTTQELADRLLAPLSAYCVMTAPRSTRFGASIDSSAYVLA